MTHPMGRSIPSSCSDMSSSQTTSQASSRRSRRKPITAETARAARKRSETLRGFTKSTYSRRALVRNLREELALFDPDPHTILGYLANQYAPATAVGYASTIASLDPELAATERWKDGFRALKKLAAQKPRRDKPTATPAQLIDLIRHAPTDQMRRTLTMLWTSCSRHKDLHNAEMEVLNEETLSIQNRHALQPPREVEVTRTWLGANKSDLFNQKNLTKFLQIPKEHARVLYPPWEAYDPVLKYIKSRHPILAVHAIRRGSHTSLAAVWSNEEVTCLSAHASKYNSLGPSFYIAAHWYHLVPSLQRAMSAHLFGEVVEALTAPLCEKSLQS